MNFLATLPVLDWIAITTGLAYVILAARANNWCWFWGIISCSCWAYASFYSYNLWFDAGLQLFYVGMAVFGWWQWRNGSQATERPITRVSQQQHLYGIIGGLVAGGLFGYFFATYTPAAATYLDAITTIFAVFATFLLVQKKLENWLYWIVVDVAYIYLYGRQGAWLFAGLMAIYVVIAAKAYYDWRRIYLDSI